MNNNIDYMQFAVGSLFHSYRTTQRGRYGIQYFMFDPCVMSNDFANENTGPYTYIKLLNDIIDVFRIMTTRICFIYVYMNFEYVHVIDPSTIH